jgi:hypothetical protein
LVGALPKLPNGKIEKTKLRERLRAMPEESEGNGA